MERTPPAAISVPAIGLRRAALRHPARPAAARRPPRGTADRPRDPPGAAAIAGRPAGRRRRHRAARQAGWSDAEWARRAGLPKETLCRLRSRSNCDLATLQALSGAVGRQLAIEEPRARSRADGLWPAIVDRRLESRLMTVVHARSRRPEDWRPLGPPFFLAGLAVTLASVAGLDRRGYLDLAETLHPGASDPRVFNRWLAETPLPPARFLPMLQARPYRAA